MTRNQFELLSMIEREGGTKLTQRQMAEETGMSLGIINRTLSELISQEFVCLNSQREIQITKLGIRLLEPYRVKRAVILAAGVSSRMMPITLNTPKPLVRVHGRPIIETILDALIHVGVSDITIVRGYMKEQFDVLANKYPNLNFIDNPMFNETNNISSAWMARNHMQAAYVLEADLIIKNPKIIRKYEYCSNHLGIYYDRTDDWCFEVKKGHIKKVQIGGKKCYRMCGISFWSEEDGKRLQKCLDQTWKNPGGKERYWDEVPFREFIRDFDVEIRPCREADLIEVDTWKELQTIDPAYQMV